MVFQIRFNLDGDSVNIRVANSLNEYNPDHENRTDRESLTELNSGSEERKASMVLLYCPCTTLYAASVSGSSTYMHSLRRRGRVASARRPRAMWCVTCMHEDQLLPSLA